MPVPGFGRGAAEAEDAQGTPAQSHMSPGTIVYEEKEGVGTSGSSLMAEERNRSLNRFESPK